jgi:ATP-dependent Clp protease ATP-binding subunit ClpB
VFLFICIEHFTKLEFVCFFIHIRKAKKHAVFIENGDISPDARTRVTEILRASFRPEFLNRLDEILEFDSLSREQIREIVKLQLVELEKRLADQNLSLQVGDDAIEVLVSDGYDPQFGARPVKRVIQRNLLNDLSKQILSEQVSKDSVIEVDVADNHLVFLNK